MTDNDYRPLFPTEPPRQTLERNRLQPPPRKGQISYDEFLTWATANGKSARPIGRFETNPPDRAPSKPKITPKAPIAPHAGYIYSGPPAATAFATLRDNTNTLARIVLIGPAHYVAIRGVAGARARTRARSRIAVLAECIAIVFTAAACRR